MGDTVRTTLEVIRSHLQCRVRGDVEADIELNYADDARVLCEDGVLLGAHGVRESARRLGAQLPDGHFEFEPLIVAGEHAMLVWRARSERWCIRHAADSFHVRRGLIVMQSIFYRLEKP